MASAKETCSPEQLAKRLLKFLQNADNEHDVKLFAELLVAKAADSDEVFEQLRIQSNQFASIYPLLEGQGPALKGGALLHTLYFCAQSSVSANLLANEKRVWVFLVASFVEDDHAVIIQTDGSKRCERLEYSHIIQYLIPYVSKSTWKVVVRCGLLEQLLAGMQKKPRTCNSLRILTVIVVVLSRPITQGSIDTLVSGGLFRLLEQVIQKSGKLLKGTPPCPECNFSMDKDFNLFSDRFLMVKFFFVLCVRYLLIKMC